MLVIFDTCTKPAYRKDVHRLLSLPEEAVIRYNYKRYLHSDDAAEVLSTATERDLPIRALLFYGELNGYNFGDPDTNLAMLRWSIARFIPTRVAEIVNVAVNSTDADESQHVFDMHLKCGGFLDPEHKVIEPLIGELEARDELPFGAIETQFCWVSTFPEGLDVKCYEDAAPDNWSAVVQALTTKETEFAGDAFWRISGIRRVKGKKFSKVRFEE